MRYSRQGLCSGHSLSFNVIGTSVCMHIKNRGPAALRPLMTKSSRSGSPPIVCNTDTTSSLLGGSLMLKSLLYRLDKASVRGWKWLNRLSTNLGMKMVPEYCSNSGIFSYFRDMAMVVLCSHLTIGSCFSVHYRVMEHAGSLESTKEA